MGVQITVSPGARLLGVEPPDQRRVRMTPVLQVAGPDVEDSSQPSVGDEFVSERQCRHPAIVEPDEGPNALAFRLASRVPHGPSVVEGPREGLFAGHVLPRRQGLDRHRRVQVIRGADVHQIHLGVGDQVMPVRGAGEPAPLLGETAGLRPVPTTRSLHSNRARKVEEPTRRHPRVGVGLAHELGADDADPERLALGGGLRSGGSALAGLGHGRILSGVRGGVIAVVAGPHSSRTTVERGPGVTGTSDAARYPTDRVRHRRTADPRQKRSPNNVDHAIFHR